MKVLYIIIVVSLANTLLAEKCRTARIGGKVLNDSRRVGTLVFVFLFYYLDTLLSTKNC